MGWQSLESRSNIYYAIALLRRMGVEHASGYGSE